MNIAEPIIRIEKILVSLVDDVKKLKEDLIKVNQSLDDVKKAMNKHEEECVTKEPEKKYRPYSLEEFSNIFKVGDLIVFRMKNDDEVKCAMFTGYITDVERIDDKTPGAFEVMLGIFHYSLFSLFEDFEWFYNGRWKPFGILSEENEE